jgi:hypothetical protein
MDNMLFHGDGRSDRRIGRAFSNEISWMGVCKFTVMHWDGSLNPNLYVMFVNVCILNFMCNVHSVMGDTE